MRALLDVLRALVRLLALIFTAAGLAALGFLVTVLLAGGGMAGQALGRVWFEHHVASLNLVQAIVQRRLHPALWDPGIVTVLGWPAWMGLVFTALLFFIIGATLFGLTRRRG